jgi:elongation factor P
MISVTELRAGKTFQIDGVPYQVVEYKHTKMGRGTATIRVKVRNLKDGSVVEKTFGSGAKVEPIETQLKTVQYLYRERDNFYFMDPASFEQFSLPKKVFWGKEKFLKEQEEFKILFWSEQPLAVEFPLFMVFKVIQTSPGVKGNSVTASFKPATLNNGLVVRVPLFINVDDKIKVDTRTGEYVERVSNA